MAGCESVKRGVVDKRFVVVYLAGPYRPYVDDDGVRHGIAENVRVAGEHGLEIWRRGYVALVPHTLTYLSPNKQRLDGGIRDIAPEVFMRGELELLWRSDVLVLLPEWRYSEGAAAEKAFAESLGIPVYEWADFLRLDDQGLDIRLTDPLPGERKEMYMTRGETV
jgi:hypothetical protein